MNPFFSICIPTTNREKTIYNTLSSVASQSFRDFEVIVVDCGSTDNTRAEIDRFFKSDCFAKHPFYYKYETRDYYPQTVEDWNEPLKLAGGKYIAMLEGDDQYLPNHLRDAYNYLDINDNIGLYAVGNQHHSRLRKGKYASFDWIKSSIVMEDVTPPSESIFVRVDKDGNPILYDDINYEYSPEADLYVRLALLGYDVYFSDLCDVYRTPSNSNWYSNTWHFFIDRYTLLERYKNFISEEAYKRTVLEHNRLAIRTAIYSKSFYNFLSVSRKVISKMSLVDYLQSIYNIVVSILNNKRNVRS